MRGPTCKWTHILTGTVILNQVRAILHPVLPTPVDLPAPAAYRPDQGQRTAQTEMLPTVYGPRHRFPACTRELPGNTWPPVHQ